MALLNMMQIINIGSSFPAMMTIFKDSAGSDPHRNLACCLCAVCGPWIIVLKNGIIILRETGGPLFTMMSVLKGGEVNESC